MRVDRRIKFRHLQCFLEVAGTGHVGQAADALAVTQPAVSKTLRELEEALGARLFDRAGRKMRLTEAGELFRRHAAASVAALAQGVETLRQSGEGGAALRVGALPTAATTLMSGAALTFKARRPETTLSVETGPNDLLLARLRTGDLDLVVGRLAPPAQMTGLAFEHLYEESLILAARAGHPLSQGPVDPARLAEFPVILPSSASIIRPFVEEFLLARGIVLPRPPVETISFAFGRGLLSASDSVWFISRGVVEEELAAGRMVALDLGVRGGTGSVGLTTRATEDATPDQRVFVACLRAEARRRNGG